MRRFPVDARIARSLRRNGSQQAGEQVERVATVAEAKKLGEEIDRRQLSQLELLTETVSNLRIDDATKRTEIIDSIGDVFASLNRVRSALKARVTRIGQRRRQSRICVAIETAGTNHVRAIWTFAIHRSDATST